MGLPWDLRPRRPAATRRAKGGRVGGGERAARRPLGNHLVSDAPPPRPASPRRPRQGSEVLAFIASSVVVVVVVLVVGAWPPPGGGTPSLGLVSGPAGAGGARSREAEGCWSGRK